MAYWKYLKYVIRHKYYVAIECFKRDLYWAGIFHDVSKFSPYEFHNYAMFFNGKGQQNQKGDTLEDGGNPLLKQRMENSWLLHVRRNKHHWNYWILIDRKNEMQIFDMPNKYITEMICDWEGASKALRGQEAKAKDWYERQKNTLILSNYTRSKVELALGV